MPTMILSRKIRLYPTPEQEKELNKFASEIKQMLTYKSELYGIKLITASRWYPSSKMCNVCKKKYDSTKQPEGKWSLKIRKWSCIHCKTSHDRDMNAAINLANYIENIKNKTFVA